LSESLGWFALGEAGKGSCSVYTRRTHAVRSMRIFIVLILKIEIDQRLVVTHDITRVPHIDDRSLSESPQP
jgi:hypothetical protein